MLASVRFGVGAFCVYFLIYYYFFSCISKLICNLPIHYFSVAWTIASYTYSLFKYVQLRHTLSGIKLQIIYICLCIFTTFTNFIFTLQINLYQIVSLKGFKYSLFLFTHNGFLTPEISFQPYSFLCIRRRLIN